MAAFCGCSQCVMGSALAKMEGNDACDVCTFHTCCTSAPMARNYLRVSYGIKGYPGWECLAALLFAPCSAAQMMGHVMKAGPPSNLPPQNPEFNDNFGGLPSDWKDTVCLDPVNMLCITCFAPCEQASHVSTASGLPVWLSLLCSNYCASHHILRVNYGAPGNVCWGDCWEPLLCLYILPPIPFAGICTCFYTAQQMENERAWIKKSNDLGTPRLMLNYAPVEGGAPHAVDHDNYVTTTQPGATDAQGAEWPKLARALNKAAPSFATYLAPNHAE